MIIKKGNPEGLRCWRTLVVGAGSMACLAEKCVAFEPHTQWDQRTVDDAEMDSLIAADVGWKLITQQSWQQPEEKRNVVRREIEATQGECGALPIYNDSSA